MSDAVKIRKAGLGDFEAILSFCRELSPNFEEELLRNSFVTVSADASAVVFIAEVDQRPAGFIEVHLLNSLQSAKHALIRALFVSAEFRRQGVARALTLKAEGWASAQGVGKILVQSKVERTAARDFYLEAGYDVFKVQNVYKKLLV